MDEYIHKKYQAPLIVMIIATVCLLCGMWYFIVTGDLYLGLAWTGSWAIVVGFCDGILFGYGVEDRKRESKST